MRIFSLMMLMLAVTTVALAGDTVDTTSNAVTTRSPYPYLTPQERTHKIKQVLDPETGDKDRFDAVWGLAISGYTREGAEALTVIAVDPRHNVTMRSYAGMGLQNFSSAMPEEVRKPIQDKLYGALAAEKDKLPDGVMRLLVAWGDADRILKVLGDKFRGHHMEIAILRGITSRADAVARLVEIYEAAAPAAISIGWTQRWHVGAALIEREDKRGVDILLECLTVKEPWPIDNPSAEAQANNAASFHQSLHNTFDHLARLFDDRFGYEAAGTWTPQLNEAIQNMVAWWHSHRETWSFQ